MTNYVSEFNGIRASLPNSPLTNSPSLIGPALCCQVAGFEFDDVVAAGWLQDNINSLSAISVQKYPANNCQVNGRVLSGQDLFPNYLNHTAAQSLVSLYTGTSAQAMAAGKEIVMLETNTASCGGFPGLSDSFGAAMW